MSAILVLDNYDSFTYNLVALLQRLSGDPVLVRRNDCITVDEASQFARIVLSPGPGLPCEAGVMPQLVEALAPTHHLLGVCLGHQCIAEVFGGQLKNLASPVHGETSQARVRVTGTPFFADIPSQFSVGRYHSWVVDRLSLTPELVLLAEDEEGEVMALQHRSYSTIGVQFHPESFLTAYGEQMISNWLRFTNKSDVTVSKHDAGTIHVSI